MLDLFANIIQDGIANLKIVLLLIVVGTVLSIVLKRFGNK